MPGGWELLIIVAVVLLLFGARRLPEMARSVGQSARVLKGEMKGLRDDEARAAAAGAPPAAPEPPAPQPPVPPVASAPAPQPMVVDPYPVPPSGRGV